MDAGRRLDELCRETVAREGLARVNTHCMEECGELITAIAKLDRAENGSTLNNVAQEIADVELVCHVMKVGHGIAALVDIWKMRKLARLARGLKKPWNPKKSDMEKKAQADTAEAIIAWMKADANRWTNEASHDGGVIRDLACRLERDLAGKGVI